MLCNIAIMTPIQFIIFNIASAGTFFFIIFIALLFYPTRKKETHEVEIPRPLDTGHKYFLEQYDKYYHRPNKNK